MSEETEPVEEDDGEELDEQEVELDLNVLANEAYARPFTFRYGEHVYTLAEHVDMRVVTLAQGGRDFEAMQAMLGDQLEQFLHEPVPFGQNMLADLLQAWSKHGGMTLPKLQASPGSLSQRARRSKPTSVGSTKSTSRTSRRAG